jgi:hypothetical protein
LYFILRTLHSVLRTVNEARIIELIVLPWCEHAYPSGSKSVSGGDGSGGGGDDDESIMGDCSELNHPMCAVAGQVDGLTIIS